MDAIGSLAVQPVVTVSVLEQALEPHRFIRSQPRIEPWGRTLSELLPDRVQLSQTPWLAVVNGRVIPAETWATELVPPGGEVICYPRIGDSVFGQILFGAVLAAAAFALPELGLVAAGAFTSSLGILGAGIALTGAASLLVGTPLRPVKPLRGGNGSPTYGFEGVKNSKQVGAPVPVVYGTHKVGGQYIEIALDTSGDTEILHALLALSEGPVQLVDTSHLAFNNQPAANFSHVTVATTTGQNSQAAISPFGDHSAETFLVDAALSPEPVSYTTNGTNVTAFTVELAFPNGFFTVKPDGGLQSASVTVILQYKLHTAETWTSQTFVVTDSKRSTLRQLLRVDGLAAGQYDIQLSRTTPQATSLFLVDEVHRTAISEIVNDACTYPNLALLGVSIQATNQLSGTLPTITVYVQGVQVRVFSSATSYAWQYSNNPAWVAFDMFTNARYGLGNFVWPVQADAGTIAVTNGSPIVTGTGTAWTQQASPGQMLVVDSQGLVATVLSVQSDTQLTLTTNWAGSTASGLAYELRRDDLDIQSFVDWAAYCNTSVDNGQGGMEPRCTCDAVFDAENVKAWDAIQQICALGQAAPVKLGSFVRITVDQPASPTQLFSMANIKAGSYQEKWLNLKDRANYFEVQYLNAANDYQQEVVVLEDPLLFQNQEPIRRKQISLYGVTRTTQAARLARYYQNANRYYTRTVSFEAGLDAVVAEPGDVIRVQHDVPGWGAASRAAAGSTAATIALQTSVALRSGASYQILVRHADGTIEQKAVTNAPGTYTTLTVDSAWTEVPAAEDVVVVGETTILVKLFRVIAIERTPDMTVKITGVEYNPAAYDNRGTTVNQVNFSTLPDLAGPPPQVTDFALAQLNDSMQTVVVNFTPPADVRYDHANLYQVAGPRFVKLGESTDGHFTIPNVMPGTILRIAAVSAGRGGAMAGFNSAPAGTITIGAAHPPPTVTGLQLAGQGNHTQFVGKDAKFTWKDRARTSGLGRSPLGQEPAGAGSGFVDPFFKNYRVEIYNADTATLRRREFVTDAAYIYGFEKNFEDGQFLGGGPVRSFTIKVWQQDAFNQLSSAPALLTVSNPAPPLVTNLAAFSLGAAIRVKWDASPAIDTTGYRVFRSTTPGFTPDSTTLVYDGPNNFVDFNDVLLNTTYWFCVAAYDTFDTTSLNHSGQVSAAPLGIVAGDITGQLADSQLAGLAASKIQGVLAASLLSATTAYITASAQIADAVIVNAHIANVDASKITTGTLDALRLNTTTAYITASAQIASGVIQTAHIANLAVGTAQIANLAVGTLQIAGNAVTQNKVYSTTADVSVTAATVLPYPVLSVALATNSGEVLVSALCTYSMVPGDSATLALERDGVVLTSVAVAGLGNAVPLTLVTLDAPPAATHQYALVVTAASLSASFILRSISMLTVEILK